MTTFNVEELKETFMDSIRTYVYPIQPNYSTSISLFSEGNTINQEVYFLSESISACAIYVAETIGSPTGVSVSLLHGSRTLAAGTIPCTVGWNTIACSAGDVVSGRLSTLRIENPTGSSILDVYIGNEANSYFLTTVPSTAIAFSIGTKDFVYKVYPTEEIENDRVPVISVDVVGRPKIVDKYLSGDAAWFYTSMRADVYAKTTREVDKMAYAIERGLMKDRKVFSQSYYVTPAMISPISWVKPELHNRYVTWTVRQLIARE